MRLLGAIVLGLAVVGSTSAANSFRFKLKPGITKTQAIKRTEQKLNRTTGFSGADCWLYDGNLRIGWRHGACVGTFNYQGTNYRFKATYTPTSCSRQRSVIVILGVKTQTGTVPWRHDTFVCGRG
jgi:hypothetical protein